MVKDRTDSSDSGLESSRGSSLRRTSTAGSSTTDPSQNRAESVQEEDTNGEHQYNDIRLRHNSARDGRPVLCPHFNRLKTSVAGSNTTPSSQNRAESVQEEDTAGEQQYNDLELRHNSTKDKRPISHTSFSRLQTSPAISSNTESPDKNAVSVREEDKAREHRNNDIELSHSSARHKRPVSCPKPRQIHTSPAGLSNTSRNRVESDTSEEHQDNHIEQRYNSVGGKRPVTGPCSRRPRTSPTCSSTTDPAEKRAESVWKGDNDVEHRENGTDNDTTIAGDDATPGPAVASGTSARDKGKTRTFKSVVERQIGQKDRLFDLVKTLLKSIAEEQQATNDLITSFKTAREIKVPLAELFPPSTSQETPKPKKKRSLRAPVPLIERIEKSRQAKVEEEEETERVIAEEMELLERENYAQPESLIHIPVANVDGNEDPDTDPVSDNKCSKDDSRNEETNSVRSQNFPFGSMTELGKSRAERNNETDLDQDYEQRNDTRTIIVEVERDECSNSLHNASKSGGSKESIAFSEDEKQSFENPLQLKRSTSVDSEELGTSVKSDSHLESDGGATTGQNTIKSDSYSDDFESSDVEISGTQMGAKNKPKHRKVFVLNMEYRSTACDKSVTSSGLVVNQRESSQYGQRTAKRRNKKVQTSPRRQSPSIDRHAEHNGVSHNRSSSSKRKHGSSVPESNFGDKKPETPRSRSGLSINGRSKSRGSSSLGRRSDKQKKLISLNLLEMYEGNSDLQKVDKPPKQNFRFNNYIKVSTIGRRDSNSARFAKYRRKNKNVPLPPKTFSRNTPRKQTPARAYVDHSEESTKVIRAYSSRQENRRYRQPDDAIWRHIDVNDVTSDVTPRDTSRQEKAVGDSILHQKAEHNRQSSARSAKGPSVRFIDMQIADAIKTVKCTPNLPPCRDVVEMTPRKARVSQIYSDLKKDRKGTDYMSVSLLPGSPVRRDPYL